MKQPKIKTLGDRIRACRIWAAPQQTTEFDRHTGRPLMPLSEVSLLLTGSRGASRRHLGLIEKGARKHVQVTTVASIAALFGVSIDWLVFGSNGHNDPDPAAVKATIERAREAAFLPPVGTVGTGTDG